MDDLRENQMYLVSKEIYDTKARLDELERKKKEIRYYVFNIACSDAGNFDVFATPSFLFVEPISKEEAIKILDNRINELNSKLALLRERLNEVITP